MFVHALLVARRLALSTTAAVGLLILAAPQVASAASGQAGYVLAAPASTASPSLAISPSGCVQTAMWPHASTHVPGTMNGGIGTKCSRVVPQISLTAQMWETRWWGWDRIGIVGRMNAYYHNAALTYANDRCRKSTIRTTGTGYVIDIDNQHYYASTESKHVYNPCNL